ncbi:MAG: hypothetical protein R3237_06480 [Nitrosopumilaceae archaeon]|nr:hypothetical protein [Nitrosopumilaceae archaeon]
MQIVKEKNLYSLPEMDSGLSNHESAIDYGLEAKDMIGLSWIFLDSQTSDLAYSKRRCTVIE